MGSQFGRALACCKVGLERPLIPTAVVANLFRSARVFRWGAVGRGLGDRRSQRTGQVRRPLLEPEKRGVPAAINARKISGVGPGDFLSPRSPPLRIDWPLATVLEPLATLLSPATPSSPTTRHSLLRGEPHHQPRIGFVFDPPARSNTIQPQAVTSFALILDWLRFAHFLASSRRKAGSAGRNRPGTVGLSRPFPRTTRFQSCRSSNHQ